MKKELPYILLSLVLCSILIFYPLSFDLVLLEGTLGTNAHDTYFVVDPTYHIISSCIISFAFVYFLRVLFTKFNYKLANYIYVFFNGLFFGVAIMNIISTFLFEIIDTVVATDHEEQVLRDSLNFTGFLYLFISLAIISFVLEIYTFFRIRERR